MIIMKVALCIISLCNGLKISLLRSRLLTVPNWYKEFSRRLSLPGPAKKAISIPAALPEIMRIGEHQFAEHIRRFKNVLYLCHRNA
ncbi:MAG TPA: hypothetical protein PLD96_02140, partial [Methanothrix sp.]|nr:hypothetical protein [Methanothrix sp.]